MIISKCICCGCDNIIAIGEIPPSAYFAGKILSKPLEGGHLFRCANCGLAFRYPRLNKAELDNLYRKGEVINWGATSSERVDWQIARRWIKHMPAASKILDIGCFDGRFLQTLASDYQKFGIEIHEAAERRARDGHINIIGRDFSDLINKNIIADAVTCFDLIEHTHNPVKLMGDLAAVTRPEGMIIISSGNSNALSSKIMGANYWYCTISEHLSFINPRWCEWVAQRLGLELKKMVRFSHVNSGWPQRIGETFKNLLYAATPSGFAFLRKIGLGGAEYRAHKELLRHPPLWMSAKDHLICLFAKR